MFAQLFPLEGLGDLWTYGYISKLSGRNIFRCWLVGLMEATSSEAKIRPHRFGGEGVLIGGKQLH
jgi:hypothetical protein